jgi:hypothetical protein
MSPFFNIGGSRKAHERESDKVPWILVDDLSMKGRLVHYLSGGGMRTFGRTLSQDVARRRHRRFMFVSAAIAVSWLVLWLV